jgi:hypothetical protein
MLLISLIALILAMLFFYLEIRSYGGFGAFRGPTAAVSFAPDGRLPGLV